MSALDRLSTASLTALLRGLKQLEREREHDANIQDHATTDDRMQNGKDLPGRHDRTQNDCHI